MSKTTAKNLASDLSLSQVRDASLDAGFEYAIEQLAQFPILTAASLIDVDHTQTEYTIPDSIGLLLAVFYDDQVLSRESSLNLLFHGPDWHDEKGKPNHYIVDSVTTKKIKLQPQPEVSSSDFTWLFGSPFGRDYPDYAIGVIHTEMRDDTPEWLDLPLALQIMAKEYAQGSRHQDITLSAACKQISETMLSVINAQKNLQDTRSGQS